MFKYFVKSKEIFLKFKSVSFSFKGLAIVASAGGLIVIFQNCAAGFDVNQEAFSSLSSTGLDFCRQNPDRPECQNVSAVKCQFNGREMGNNETVMAYLNSSVDHGKVCESQIRKCQNGVLSGSYSYASCAVGQPAACLFNGQTLPSGQSVTAFLNSTETETMPCTQEVRSCNNGVLSGSYSFASCAAMVKAPSTPSGNTDTTASSSSSASCKFNDFTIPNGKSITAFLKDNITNGSCEAETRVCNGGKLSGSYTYSSCSSISTSSAPASAPPSQESANQCKLNGIQIPNGQSITAYQSSQAAAGALCAQEIRVCTNGVLSGSFSNTSCTQSNTACTFNNKTVANGAGVVAYTSATVPFGQSCVSEVRVCINGVLSGSGAFANCSESAPAACVFNGVSVASGQSVVAYQSASGSSCAQETRVCNNGSLSGSYTNSACTIKPSSCSYNGKTIEDGDSVTGYEAATVPFGSTCKSIVRVCANGILSGSSEMVASCTEEKPKTCGFNGQTVAHGNSVKAYLAASASSCTSEQRTCTNGDLSGSYTYSSCTQVMASCNFDGQTVAHGKSITAYESSAVSYGKSCTAVKRTCYNGSLNGSGDYKSCVVDKPASCLFNGKTVAHNEKVTAYAVSSVAYGQKCAPTQRVCNNGVLSGSGDYASCAAGQAASCLVGTQTIPHGGSANFYLNDKGTTAQACKSEKRTCTNGVLSGAATATSCEDFKAGSCQPEKCDKWITEPSNLSLLSKGPQYAKDNFVGNRYCISQDLDFTSADPKSYGITDVKSSSLNGCGFKINNLKLTKGGLFNKSENASFENLTLNKPAVDIAIPLVKDDHIGENVGGSVGILSDVVSKADFKNVQILDLASAKIMPPTTSYKGKACGTLFGLATGPVNLKDIQITGDSLLISDCQYVGGVLGLVSNSRDGMDVQNIKVNIREIGFENTNALGGFAGMIGASTWMPFSFSDIQVNSNITSINSVSAGGIIGEVSYMSVNGPHTFSKLNYTGVLNATGMAKGNVQDTYSSSYIYTSGTGGLIGAVDNSNVLPPSLQNSSVTGKINVTANWNTESVDDLIAGTVIGALWNSSVFKAPDLALNVSLNVNGEASYKTIGFNDQEGASDCHINSNDKVPAGSIVKRYLTEAAGANQPAGAYVLFQCSNPPNANTRVGGRIKSLYAYIIKGKLDFKLSGVYTKQRYVPSLSSATTDADHNLFSPFCAYSDGQCVYGEYVNYDYSFFGADINNVRSNFYNMGLAVRTKAYKPFMGWLYSLTSATDPSADPSNPSTSPSNDPATASTGPLLSSITTPVSNWTAPVSTVTNPAGSTPRTREPATTPNPNEVPVPAVMLGSVRQYSADGYLWTESYPEGDWMNVFVSSDNKSIVITNAFPYAINLSQAKFYITTDSGKTWTPTVTLESKNFIDSASNDGKVILRMKEADKAISLSKDSGSTWTILNPPSKKYISGGVSGKGSKIYLSSADGKVLSSVDDGKTWKTFTVVVDPNKPSNPSNVTDATNTYNPNFIPSSTLVTFDDDNRVLHASYFGSFVSPDGGVTWYKNLNDVAIEKRWYSREKSLYVSKDKKTIIAATAYDPIQLVISKDSGQSFRSFVAEDITTASISDDGSNIVVLTTTNLYLSTDGGSSFKKLNQKYGFDGTPWYALAVSADRNTIVAATINRILIGIKSTEQVAYTLSGYDFAIKNAFPYMGAAGVDTIAMSYDGTKMMATISDSGAARNPDNNNVRYFGPATMSSGNKGVSWSPIGSNSCVNNSYIDTYGIRQWTPCGVTYSTYGSYIEMSYDGSKAISINDTSTTGGPGRGLGGGVNFPERDGSEVLYVTGMAMSSDAKKIIAFTSQGLYYTTTNGGVNWTKRSTSNIMTTHAHLRWDISAAMSADGNLIVLYTSLYGQYFKSTDGGVKWTEMKSPSSASYTSSYNVRVSVAKSGDQYIITTSFYDGKLYQSKDSGKTWKALNVAGAVDTFSTSADGKVIAVGMRDSYVYLSKDGGVTFTEQTKAGRNKWSAIKVSPDGKMLAVGSMAPNAYVQVADISAATPGATSIPAVPVVPQPTPAPAPVPTPPQPQSCESVSPTCVSGLAVWDGSSCVCTTPEYTAPTYTESYN